MYDVCKEGIFKSIQGEGHNVGKSAVFIRLAHCNMKPKCPFCDEIFEDYETIRTTDIINKISTLKPFDMVVITGGEPTMQNLTNLINGLKEQGIFVAIETNGINKVPYDLDWITCSPKTNELGIEYANEIKFVVDRDVDSMKTYIEEISNLVSHNYIYLQPRSNEEKMIQNCVEMISENEKYRLSVQIHKMIGIK